MSAVSCYFQDLLRTFRVMSLLVVSYPNIDKEIYTWIQAHRQSADELYYNTIEPHFTLVFPVEGLPENEFLAEIVNKSAGVKPIGFDLTGAKVHKDDFREIYHEFLIPETGFEEIIGLHDRLYSGRLYEYWRQDLNYIPHITIGNSSSYERCQKNAVRINQSGIFLSGVIDKLTVISYTASGVSRLMEIPLGG